MVPIRFFVSSASLASMPEVSSLFFSVSGRRAKTRGQDVYAENMSDLWLSLGTKTSHGSGNDAWPQTGRGL